MEERGGNGRGGRRRRRIVAGIALAGVTAAPAAAAALESCTVKAVLDATTLRVGCVAGERTIVLAGVRAPRPGTAAARGEAYGDEARWWVETWLAGRRVDVSGDQVRLAGGDVRLEVVRRGLASCASGDAAFAPMCGAAEEEARRARRGIWSWDAWQRHRQRGGEAVPIAEAPPPPAPASLGALAARLPRKSWEERKAEFDDALAVAAATHVPSGAAPAPATTPSRSVAAKQPARDPSTHEGADESSTSPKAGATPSCSPFDAKLCLPADDPPPPIVGRGNGSGTATKKSARAPARRSRPSRGARPASPISP